MSQPTPYSSVSPTRCPTITVIILGVFALILVLSVGSCVGVGLLSTHNGAERSQSGGTAVFTRFMNAAQRNDPDSANALVGGGRGETTVSPFFAAAAYLRQYQSLSVQTSNSELRNEAGGATQHLDGIIDYGTAGKGAFTVDFDGSYGSEQWRITRLTLTAPDSTSPSFNLAKNGKDGGEIVLYTFVGAARRNDPTTAEKLFGTTTSHPSLKQFFADAAYLRKYDTLTITSNTIQLLDQAGHETQHLIGKIDYVPFGTAAFTLDAKGQYGGESWVITALSISAPKGGTLPYKAP